VLVLFESGKYAEVDTTELVELVVEEEERTGQFVMLGLHDVMVTVYVRVEVEVVVESWATTAAARARTPQTFIVNVCCE
jgi:hypothetical protein